MPGSGRQAPKGRDTLALVGEPLEAIVSGLEELGSCGRIAAAQLRRVGRTESSAPVSPLRASVTNKNGYGTAERNVFGGAAAAASQELSQSRQSGDESRSFSERGSELAIIGDDVINYKLAFSDKFRKRFPGPKFAGVGVLDSKMHRVAMAEMQQS